MANKPLKFEVSLEGLAAVARAIDGRKVDAVKKSLRRRAYTIAKTARDEMRNAWPTGATGNLKKATKAKTTRGGGAVMFVDRSGGTSGKGYHNVIVDKGTKKRTTRKGANRGTMPAANVVAGVRARADARVNSDLIPGVKADIVAAIKGDLK
jgi:hypothetical protein